MNIVGDSYTLDDRKASALRTVNMYLRGLESEANTRGALVKFPGLESASLVAGSCRGAIESRGRVLVVFGATLYEMTIGGALTARGTLATSAGPVGMADIQSQVVIVDGPNGYVFSMATSVLSQITSPTWLGSNTVAAINNRAVFHQPETQVWYYASINDASSLDALDFASAEVAPDDLVGIIASHQELHLFGTRTKEVFYDSGAADFTFSRNSGATSEVGLAAPYSMCRIDNGVMWIGRDDSGKRGVMQGSGYVPRRVSTAAIEQILSTSSDIEGATAFAFGFDGLLFYVINAPGLETSLAFEASTGRWVELADIDSGGNFIPWRGVAHAYAYGENWIFGSDGGVYRLDKAVYSYGSDPIVCERRAPDRIKPMLERRFFGPFVAEVEARDVPQDYIPMLELSWSDDGGYSFGNPILRSMGKVGERPARCMFSRTGQSRDRVWRLRYSGVTSLAIIEAGTQG